MKTNFNQPHQTKSRGFTLVELIVSMAVTLVIVSVLLAMTRVAINGMQSSQDATRYSRISQEVLNTVSRDLEGIVIRSGNSFEWVNASDNGATGDDLGQGSNKELINPIELNFFTAATDRYNGAIGTASDAGGDISLVSYSLVHQDVIGISSGGNSVKPVFTLYRRRIDPDEAYETYLSQETLPEVGEEPDGDDFLAENIYDMTISFNFEYDKDDGTTGYQRVPIQVNGDFSEISIKGDEVLVNGNELEVENASSARLSSADISILVISDRGMNGLERTTIGSEDDLASYLKENTRAFTKSVVLPRQ